MVVITFIKKYWKPVLILAGIVAVIILFIMGQKWIAGTITMITGFIAFQKKKKENEKKVKEIDNDIETLDDEYLKRKVKHEKDILDNNPDILNSLRDL